MTPIRARVNALPSDVKILAGSLLALAVLALMMVLTAPAAPEPTLSIRSVQSDGAMALQLWLSRSGYAVSEVLSPADQLDSIRMLLVLEPQFLTDDDARLIHDWVQRGNTLIVTGTPLDSANTLLDRFQVSLHFNDSGSTALSSAAPTLHSPPFTSANDAGYAFEVYTQRTDVVTHLLSGSAPVLISLTEGQGQVWVSGAMYPFSNKGLSDPGNAAMIANLFAGVSPSTAIGFDEAAHGFSDPTKTSLFGWLTGTGPGWGILTALALTLLYLALRGRRFGHALPLPDDRLRREPVEYIQAMATLFRKSGDRAEILQHYNGQLRRRLSERYALDPRLNDADLVKMVVYRNPAIDEAGLRDLLRRLARPTMSEAELMTLISDVDRWLRSIN